MGFNFLLSIEKNSKQKQWTVVNLGEISLKL